jgi:homeobox protein cut-like
MAEMVAPERVSQDGASSGGYPTGHREAISAGEETTNKFQHAISAWRSLDFTNLISNLDNTASEIVTYQRDSTVQRKDLAQKTKDFRKLDDTTKLTEIKSLLKGTVLCGNCSETENTNKHHSLPDVH